MVYMHIYVANGLVCLYLVHVLSVLMITNVEPIIVSCRLVGTCVCVRTHACVCLFMRVCSANLLFRSGYAVLMKAKKPETH